MRCIELFAGAGGAALGLEAAGIHHAALCEWDPHACATMRAAGLGPVVEGDVRELDAIAAVAGESCDLLWSSFPCQAWSTAGKRKGAQDERNGWPWTVDAIDRFRPRWFLGENVRGLITHSSDGHPDPERCPRCYFETVILTQLRERFAHVGWRLLDAADYGVPQHRRRVILWAGPAPLQAPERTHASPAECRQAGLFGPRLRPWVSMGEALGLSRTVAYNGQKKAVGPRPGKGPDGKRPPGRFVEATFDTIDPAPTLPTGSGALQVRYIGRAEREDPHRGWEPVPDGPSPSVRAGRPGGGLAVVAAGETGEGRPRPMDQAEPTIGTKGTAYLLANPGRRRLTVEECARLQDFPAGYPFQGTKTAQYRQVGNAVPAALARVVAERVIEADRNLHTPP